MAFRFTLFLSLFLSSALGWGHPALAELACALRFEEIEPPVSRMERMTGSLTKILGQEESYAPVKQAKVVHSNAVKHQALEWAEKLQKMKVKFTTDDRAETYLSLRMKAGGVNFVNDSPGEEPFPGIILKINELPPAGRNAHPESLALLHPQMADRLRRLQQEGYDLVVDTSVNFTGSGGYHMGDAKRIAIRPDMEWHAFEHEFQHMEFSQHLRSQGGVEPLIELRRRGLNLAKSLPPETVQRIGPAKLAKIQRLVDRGVTPELSINESLSVDAQFRAMGWHRFRPGGRGTEAYRYMLRHQITSLEALAANLTKQQQRVIDSNKLKYALSKQYDQHAAKAAVAASSVTGALALFALEQHFEGIGREAEAKERALDDAREILYDEDGDHILVQGDKVTYAHTTQKPLD